MAINKRPRLSATQINQYQTIIAIVTENEPQNIEKYDRKKRQSRRMKLWWVCINIELIVYAFELAHDFKISLRAIFAVHRDDSLEKYAGKFVICVNAQLYDDPFS